MDITASTVTISSIIALGMFLIALATFFSGRKKYSQEEEARLVRIEAMLANIEANTSDMKKRIDQHDCKLEDYGNRLTAVETRLASNAIKDKAKARRANN